MLRLRVLSLALLAAVSMQAVAADPVITFGASATNANGSISTRLTWSTTPVASSCTASGHPAWSGAKPASGTLDLPVITTSGSYTLTLSCTWPGDTGAALTWIAPTKNTDGSALTDLAGFKIYKASSAALVGTASTADQAIADPARTTYSYSNLAAGTNCFAVSAYNASNVESAKSAAGCKDSTPDAMQQAAVTLTVNPIPNAPVLTVQ